MILELSKSLSKIKYKWSGDIEPDEDFRNASGIPEDEVLGAFVEVNVTSLELLLEEIKDITHHSVIKLKIKAMIEANQIILTQYQAENVGSDEED